MTHLHAMARVTDLDAASPPGMRINKSVHWVADPEFLGSVFSRMAALLPARIDGMTLAGA